MTFRNSDDNGRRLEREPVFFIVVDEPDLARARGFVTLPGLVRERLLV